MALRRHSFWELYKTNLCQFCSLRRALKMCSHSNYLFQRCSLRNEGRGKCLKQLYPRKASFAGHLPNIYRMYVHLKKKIVLKCYTKFVLLYAITYSCTKGIGIIFNTYIKMRDSATVWGRAGMLLKVLPAIHHTPALNSMGQSSVLLSVAYLTATRV